MNLTFYSFSIQSKIEDPLIFLYTVMQFTVSVHRKLKQFSFHILVKIILENGDFPLPYKAKYDSLQGNF